MVRLKTRWNQPQRTRSLQDTGSVVAVNLWKLAADSLLQIENEGFETQTRMQRLDVITELLAYLLHLLDRVAYEYGDHEIRAALVGATAQKLVELVRNNYTEIGGEGDCRGKLTGLLNARGTEYADCSFYEGKPGFTLRRLFGEFVQQVLGEKDRRWASDYVMDVVAPKMYADLHRAIRSLLSSLPASSPSVANK